MTNVVSFLFIIVAIALSTLTTPTLSFQGTPRYVTNRRPRSPFALRRVQISTGGEELPEGFERLVPSRRPFRFLSREKIQVTDLKELRDLIKYGYRVRDLDVRGDTVLTNASYDHPVVQTLHQRKQQLEELKDSADGSSFSDGKKIALVIEGGGMRGCVGAGMATAVWYLGFTDTVDVVYGSSAGSLVGAYFVTGQLPHFGPEVYYKHIPTAGEEFIDTRALLRSCGLGIFDLRPKSVIDLIQQRMGKPVLNLDYLLETIVQKIKPLDWEAFWSKQVSKKQMLKVVTSGLLSKQTVLMSAEEGNFANAQELTNCMKASMLLPGLTGDAARLTGEQALSSKNLKTTLWPEYSGRMGMRMVNGSEPLSDAFIYEPVPYRSAVRENCTHILVLRTRADNSSVTGKMSLLERMMMSRYFGRKLRLPDVKTWMLNQYHKLIYAEDMLILRERNMATSPDDATQCLTESAQLARDAVRSASVYTIALPAGVPEVHRMESRPLVLLENVRLGFAAAYNALQIDPQLRGTGYEKALEIWPDSILNEAEKAQGSQ